MAKKQTSAGLTGPERFLQISSGLMGAAAGMTIAKATGVDPVVGITIGTAVSSALTGKFTLNQRASETQSTPQQVLPVKKPTSQIKGRYQAPATRGQATTKKK